MKFRFLSSGFISPKLPKKVTPHLIFKEKKCDAYPEIFEEIPIFKSDYKLTAGTHFYLLIFLIL